MGVNEVLGMLITIVFSIVLVSGIGYYVELSEYTKDAGFETKIEKTAQTSKGEIVTPLNANGEIVDDYVMKLEDLAMSLLVLDEYHPQPETVKLIWKTVDGLSTISTDSIILDEAFLNDRASVIKTKVLDKESNVLTSHRVHYSLEVDNQGKVAWIFEIWRGVS